ncbi:MAG: hypothetical protein QW112_04010 [Candidatus Micrarchaeia archaeon]
MHPAKTTKKLFEQQFIEDMDVVDMSTVQVMNTYSTCCIDCVPILEEQANKDIEEMRRKSKKSRIKYLLRRKKVDGRFEIEVIRKRQLR